MLAEHAVMPLVHSSVGKNLAHASGHARVPLMQIVQEFKCLMPAGRHQGTWQHVSCNASGLVTCTRPRRLWV